MRINRGQQFVIGGYTPSDRNFDALIFGLWMPQTPSGSSADGPLQIQRFEIQMGPISGMRRRKLEITPQ
jgi:hypothetical protein